MKHDRQRPPGPTPKISAVVTAHAEGRVLHACIRSVDRAADHATAAGIAVERILVLSHPTPATATWVNEFLTPQWLRLDCPVDDLSATRNWGVANSRGTYVSFVDGDDLWCAKWLVRAFAEAERSDCEAVWHPEISLYFGAKPGQHHPANSRQPGYDPAVLLDRNGYSPCWMVPRPVLERVPFVEADWQRGFGFGDWRWNCDVVAAGYQHRLVPDTWNYVRTYKSPVSLAERMTAAGLKLGPTALFSSPALGATDVHSTNVD